MQHRKEHSLFSTLFRADFLGVLNLLRLKPLLTFFTGDDALVPIELSEFVLLGRLPKDRRLPVFLDREVVSAFLTIDCDSEADPSDSDIRRRSSRSRAFFLPSSSFFIAACIKTRSGDDSPTSIDSVFGNSSEYDDFLDNDAL